MWFKEYIARCINIEKIHLQPGLIFELSRGENFEITNPNKNIDKKEIFFDVEKKTTYIECGSRKNSPQICDQTFIAPEIEAIVHINYAKENLDNWKNIQKNIIERLASFKREKFK